MTTLVLGATGATGKHLVEELIKKRQKVKIIIRSLDSIPKTWKDNELVSIIQASILEISKKDLTEHLNNCDAIASCLGHNLNTKGLFGQPRKLVTQAVMNCCNAIKEDSSHQPIKFVLMNTAGNRNRDLKETISAAQKVIVGLIRALLPPHKDNEMAADYLRKDIGQDDPKIEWVVIRPDGLINENQVSEYEIYPSPIRSAIFNAGTTSRINVGNFMARLIVEDDLWKQWKGQMPVIYNNET